MSKSGYLVTLHGRLAQWDDMKRDEKNIAICNELMKRKMAARTDTAIDPNEKQRLLMRLQS